MKIFFDVNVLLDFFLERSSKQKQLNQLFEALDENRLSGFVSVSTIQTCIFYLNQSKGYLVTRDIVRVIIQKFDVIDGLPDDILNAVNSSQSDLEDALHYSIALRNKMDAILTSDKNFQKLSKPYLPVLSIEELASALV